MKRIALLFALAAPLATLAQTTPAPAPKAATPKATTTAAPKAATPVAKKPVAAAVKLPPGVPLRTGPVKIAFTTTLRFQDFKIGDGPIAEPGKVYHVLYTGWLASDGTEFDSSDDHKQPMRDKDGKPVMDADGKPKLGDPQPIAFPQGQGRLIPGWDQGFTGMKVGGKRRLFIPYHLAYGDLGRAPKIPPKSDLIFDVELVSVTDMPTQQAPGMGRPMPGRPMPGAPGAPGAPGSNVRPPGSIQMLGPKPPAAAGTPTAPAAPSTTPAAPATPPSAPTTPPAATPPAASPAPPTPPPATTTAAPAAAPATPPQPN